MSEYSGLILVVGWIILSGVWLCAWCVFAPRDRLNDCTLLVLFAAVLWPLVVTALIVASPLIAGGWLGMTLRRRYFGGDS